MSVAQCQQLEAYLSGELSQHEAAQFATHLMACESCSTSVDQQKWLDELLRETATQVAPTALHASIDQAITKTKQRQRFAYGALAAAATLLFAFLIQQPEPTPQEATQSAFTTPQQPTPTFVGNEDIIVVQHDSPYPDVTIVEVYPTVTAQRRWSRAAHQHTLPKPIQIPGDPS